MECQQSIRPCGNPRAPGPVGSRGSSPRTKPSLGAKDQGSAADFGFPRLFSVPSDTLPTSPREDRGGPWAIPNAKQLLARNRPFTALFAFNDVSAIGPMRAFQEGG